MELTTLVEGQPCDARTLVLANQKGGVGKTTSALNIAYALARGEHRVLLVNMDPQATATMGLLAEGGVEAYRQGRSNVSRHFGRSRPCIGHNPCGRSAGSWQSAALDLAPSHIDLAETDGRREPGFDAALREALEPCRADYDYIVLDAPPNLGMLTWMALAASEDAIIPVRTEPYDTMGVGLILGPDKQGSATPKSCTPPRWNIATQYARRKSVDREVLAHLIAAMGDKAPSCRGQNSDGAVLVISTQWAHHA